MFIAFKNMFTCFKKIYVRFLENVIQCGKNAHVIQQNKYCLSEKCT